jgi:hypothetical protein
MRNHYWTIGPVADWIRGTPSPEAETSEGWDDWINRAKTAHPVRYWLADEGLDYLQKFVFWIPDQLYALKYYVNNRWVTRTHALTAHARDIKPGEWRDVGNRFLPCLFNELQDFVEVELAWWHIAWSDKQERARYAAPFWAVGWWRWRTWRCVQAGLDNLEWQRNLRWDEDEGFEPGDANIGKLTPQAVKAQELLDLYTWWTQIYRNRPDPYEASGWTAVCDEYREENGAGVLGILRDTKNKDLKKRKDRASKLLTKIEAAYEKEDEDMMIRLIRVRHGLWT